MDEPTQPDFSWHPEPELIGVRDPARSRAALERLGAATWGAALDYLYAEGLRRGTGEPVGYAELRSRFYGNAGGPGPAPADPAPSAELLALFRDRLAPHMLNAWHPRTLSYFTPPPLMLSVLGELLAQITQQGVDVWHAGPVAAFVEEEVLRWLCDLVDYPAGSFGILTSGGVMANFLAMALVRDVHLRRLADLPRPPRGAQLEGCRIYVSDQAHFSIGRALAELGFPDATLAVIPSDDDFRLPPAAVAAAVAADRAAGIRPLAVAAVAGTTNTGTVDPLAALAEVARREGLWFHVDAAYGAAARLSARDAARVPDLGLADSVTVDPHKWFFQAYDIGALLLREGGLLAETFSRRPEYYRTGSAETQHGAAAAHDDALDFYRMGFEGTRRWRALKLWLSWRHLGTRGLGRLVEMNDDLAAALADRIAASPDFEACPSRPELSVVCFRHLPGGRHAAGWVRGEILDAHQDMLQAALAEDGDGWLSTTRLRGRTWLRAGILNYLTTEDDLDRLLDDLRRLAAG